MVKTAPAVAPAGRAAPLSYPLVIGMATALALSFVTALPLLRHEEASTP